MRRLIIHIDPKDGSVTEFRYDGDQEPPPIVSPKIKKRRPPQGDDAVKDKDKPS